MKNTILRISFALLSACAFGQSASLMPVPRQTFGVCNTALAGGHVYSYFAGGTTAAPTYVDSLGVIQNANPVVLDVCGRAAIYLGANDYKIVVTDANNVQQYSQDHVSNNIFAGSINSLAYNLNGHPLASSDLADGTTVAHTNQAFASINGELNAALCVGSDIGQQVNSCIGQLPNICGSVYIPAGTYNQTTTINKPRCVKLHGASANGTTLNWLGSTTGWAMTISDSLGDGHYPEGAVEDLTLAGPGTTGNGIFVGGDPANVITPSGNFGDHTNLNRIRVIQFNTLVGIGSNTWSFTAFESEFGNGLSGIVGTPSAVNSGENLRVIGGSIQNNQNYAINNNNFYAPGWSVKLIGASIDYNGNGVIAPIQGGFASADAHFEQSTGPFFDTTGASGGWVHDSNSFFLLTGAATPCFGSLSGGGLPQPSSFVGTMFYAANANTDIFCNPGQATANFWGVQVLGAAVNSRGPNYFAGGLNESDGSFGTKQLFSVGYCEGTTGITTLSTGATTTDTGASCLPTLSVIDAVVYRVTTAITTAASFQIGDASTAGRFCGAQSILTAGATGVCIAQVGTTGQQQAAAAKIRVTTNANPGAGAIRLVVYYHTLTPPTS